MRRGNGPEEIVNRIYSLKFDIRNYSLRIHIYRLAGESSQAIFDSEASASDMDLAQSLEMVEFWSIESSTDSGEILELPEQNQHLQAQGENECTELRRKIIYLEKSLKDKQDEIETLKRYDRPRSSAGAQKEIEIVRELRKTIKEKPSSFKTVKFQENALAEKKDEIETLKRSDRPGSSASAQAQERSEKVKKFENEKRKLQADFDDVTLQKQRFKERLEDAERAYHSLQSNYEKLHEIITRQQSSDRWLPETFWSPLLMWLLGTLTPFFTSLVKSYFPNS